MVTILLCLLFIALFWKERRTTGFLLRLVALVAIIASVTMIHIVLIGSMSHWQLPTMREAFLTVAKGAPVIAAALCASVVFMRPASTGKQ